jgi:predicted dehydrogenase
MAPASIRRANARVFACAIGRLASFPASFCHSAWVYKNKQLSSPKVKSVSGTTVKKLVDCEGMFSLWGDLAAYKKMYDVEDFAVGLVKFKDGKTLLLEASFLLNMKENEVVDIDMFGTNAGAYLSLYGQVELHKVKDKNVFAIEQVANLPGTAPHSDQIRAFLTAVEKNKPVPVPPEETLEVIKILEGIYRSSATGKEVTFS